jgi:hypothetical protein
VPVGRHTPLLLHGMVPMDRVWAVFPITPFLFNGRRAAPALLAMLGGGAVLDCATMRRRTGPWCPSISS